MLPYHYKNYNNYGNYYLNYKQIENRQPRDRSPHIWKRYVTEVMQISGE